MFSRPSPDPVARTFQFPLRNSQVADLHSCLAVGAYHSWRCPVCPWEFLVVAQTAEDFERLIETHERETHNV